jgi:hypothetical protein
VALAPDRDAAVARDGDAHREVVPDVEARVADRR